MSWIRPNGFRLIDIITFVVAIALLATALWSTLGRDDKPMEHIMNYGIGVEARLTGAHETAPCDGVGGADPRRDSGLIGLEDRVEALGGTIRLVSPRGGRHFRARHHAARQPVSGVAESSQESCSAMYVLGLPPGRLSG